MVNLRVGSLNVKGLANDKKRKEIVHWLHGKNMNIYFLQETHSSNENVNFFQNDWEGRCLFSNKNTASAGVMILFNTNCEYKLENVVTDSDGRYLICTIAVNNEQIVLGNYYGLNSDELYLLEDLCSKVNQFDDLPMILGGDWNMVMDTIDKKRRVPGINS
jgi:exonuclease III